ncbi:MAG: hypothetical protein ABL962_06570 [Fimbriimonadaceae bacterium]
MKHLGVNAMLPGLRRDQGKAVRNVALRLHGPASNHDAAMFLWSPSPAQEYLAHFESSEGDPGRDTLIIVLGRRDRLDAAMFGIEETASARKSKEDLATPHSDGAGPL